MPITEPRIKKLEDQVTRWLKSLSDEELTVLAADCPPAWREWLSHLNTDQLSDIVHGRWPRRV